MKPAIFVSVLLNVALLLVAVLRPHSQSGPPSSWVLTKPPALPIPGPQAGVTPGAALPLSGERRGWDWVESRDLAQLIKNLRAVGCPELTIQDVVCLRLCRSLRQKLLDRTAAQQRATPYWKAGTTKEQQEQVTSRQGVSDELNAALEQLFGEDGWRIRQRIAGFSRQMGAEYLPAEKSRQLREIERRYRQLDIDLRYFGGTFDYVDDAAATRTRELNQEKTADIQRVLTPAEFEEWLVHSSKAADYVRRNLPEAQSEDEFRRMVKVAGELDMNQEPLSPAVRYGLADDDSDSAKAIKEKQETLERRLAEELGQDRVKAQREAEAQREKLAGEERARGEALAIMEEIGAGREEANRFYDRMKVELIPKFEALERELMPPDATVEQKKAFETRVKSEMEQLATEVIGAEKAKALMQKMAPEPTK